MEVLAQDFPTWIKTISAHAVIELSVFVCLGHVGAIDIYERAQKIAGIAFFIHLDECCTIVWGCQ